MLNIDIFSNSHKVRTYMVQVMLLWVAFPLIPLSALEKNGVGARAISLANSYVAIADDPWAVFYNPAGLARISSLRASAFFSPALYGMNELRTLSAGATLPLDICTGGVAIDQFGYDLYRETTMSFAFGATVNEWVALGATTHIYRLAIKGYGVTTGFVFDAGGIASVTGDVRLGWCWKNFTQSAVGLRSEQLPQILSMGVCYEITNLSRITAELEKDMRHPIVKKFGYEQQIFGILSIRFGISDNPDKFSCGLGLRAAGIEFSYAGYSHPQLGWTHQVELAVLLSP
jgi:hypothetical protein